MGFAALHHGLRQHVPDASGNAIWKNCVLYILLAREFLHSLDPKRTSEVHTKMLMFEERDYFASSRLRGERYHFLAHQIARSITSKTDTPHSGPNCRRAEGNVRRLQALVTSRQRGSSASAARR
jgi:hypothetical protein